MLNTLSFDKRGYLRPYSPITVDLDTFKANFVTAFPSSSTRKQLFNNYLRYLYRFQDEVFPIFEQWINSSFVTQKENPEDIDLVTFLDYEVYEKRGDQILDKFWSFSLENEKLDAYIVKVFPENHQDFFKFKKVEQYWLDIYTHTHPKKTNPICSKGFLHLKFSPQEEGS